MRKRRTRALVATAVLAVLVGSASASAAKAPAGFFGVVPQTSLSGADFARMGKGKVGTLRTIFTWAAIDKSSAPEDNDWSSVDPIVLEAARNGVEVLPFVFGTPQWVAKSLDKAKCNSQAKCVYYAPKSKAALDAFESFMTAAVARYGPGGRFWTLNPGVTPDPIRNWQIWNEQNSKSFFRPKPKPGRYAKLLAAANRAIDGRDPGADVVLGGTAELAGLKGTGKAIPGSKYLAKLYKVKGVKKSFDAVAPHPYGATLRKVTSQVNLYRKAMKHAGDRGAEMYVTEVGAGSKKGGNPLNRGKKGQAKLLKQIYKYFLRKRKKLNVESVEWFSWMDAKSICSWCASSGLLDKRGKAKPSYKAFTKLTGGRAG